MQHWLIFAFLTLVIWGFYGFFPKLTIPYMHPKSAMVFQTLGAVIVAILMLTFALKLKPELHPKGILFAILTGITGITGAFFFLSALNAGGKASLVVTLTALYPLVTILLSFLLLHETITLTQGIGMLLAIIAILFISV